MRRLILGTIVSCLVFGASAAQQTPPEPVVPDLHELLKGVHLYGCQTRVHLAGDRASECLSLRGAILARALTGNIAQRRHDFQDAAKVCHDSRSLKACVQALERRAAD